METDVGTREINLKESILYRMPPPKKYNTEEERIEAYKAQQNKYSMKDWKCDICQCIIKLGNKSKHLKSKKHRKNNNISHEA